MRGSALLALLPAAAALEGACQARNDTSIMGHDILAEAEHLLLPDPAACCAACQANSSCQYWTWYRRMAHEGSRCYLKSSAAGIKAAASRGGDIASMGTSGTGVVWHQMSAAPVLARVWVMVRRFAAYCSRETWCSPSSIRFRSCTACGQASSAQRRWEAEGRAGLG